MAKESGEAGLDAAILALEQNLLLAIRQSQSLYRSSESSQLSNGEEMDAMPVRDMAVCLLKRGISGTKRTIRKIDPDHD
ncbi:hypothetical protein GWK36_11390 [Caldichromatium japonicum]|uniref:Uncharacterized protein n=1 Tax=Caldichromatium japonicum TaxID=2699430 RepID=A0A6G7VF39_9GAMM|nr:hypothetical protein [Caldichromatium japonicum]QIK38486.1 hypothetical protein GWK36_11390 [Caldichromatium japonicum]